MSPFRTGRRNLQRRWHIEQNNKSKGGLDWFEVHFPPELSRAQITRALQPLAYRPKVGWLQRTPAVVFELRASKGLARWLVGIERRISGELSAQFVAQLPGLTLVRVDHPERQSPRLAAEVETTTNTQPLRVDMATGVAAGLAEIVQALNVGESAVVQWVIGAPQQRDRLPQPFSIVRALGLVAIHQATAEERRAWKQKTAEPLVAVRGRIGSLREDT